MKGFLKSFVFALKGLAFAWSGRNFRVQCAAAVMVTALGFLFGISPTEWFAVITMVALVLSAEVFNSAIESIVNFVSPEYHPLAGKIKDLAAGAVLILAIASLVTGLIIFVPYVIALL